MALLTIIVLCVTAAMAGAKEYTPLSFGLEMGNKAYKAVCWYENLKVFPKTHGGPFLKCQNGFDSIVPTILEPDQQNKLYFEAYPEKQETAFGEWVPKMMAALPSEYNTNCQQYLEDRKAAPSSDESDVLNDGGNDYMYKAFAYCLIKTLRDKHGEKAIEAVKSERTRGRKHWITAVLERENEFRARHGAEPLVLLKDLNDDAQVWADKIAGNCKSEHSSKSESLFNGENTGESLFSGGGPDESDISAYQAATRWYEEIQHYPYPEGYTDDDDNLFKKIGHFTQTVWKGTKYVGYGYKYNKDCKPFQKYLVARYFPAGNVGKRFKENVAPPKD